MSSATGDGDDDGFLAAFLPALNEQIAESVNEVTGEVENALHQQLESTGNKQQQTRQLNAVSKSSGKYMAEVHRAFEKNFEKFELYVHRNIVSIPDPLADEVAQLRVEKRREKGTKETTSGVSAANAAILASLSKQERRERRVDIKLDALRSRLRELSESNQRLEFEKEALDQRMTHFQNLTTRISFLEDMPHRAISPLKRSVEQISSLHGAFQQMDAIQASLEEDSRAFKRSKTATRGSFRNLRKRFMARTSEMAYTTTEDLQLLHSKLLTM